MLGREEQSFRRLPGRSRTIAELLYRPQRGLGVHHAWMGIHAHEQGAAIGVAQASRGDRSRNTG